MLTGQEAAVVPETLVSVCLSSSTTEHPGLTLVYTVPAGKTWEGRFFMQSIKTAGVEEAMVKIGDAAISMGDINQDHNPHTFDIKLAEGTAVYLGSFTSMAGVERWVL
jgi:hypothetical protein